MKQLSDILFDPGKAVGEVLDRVDLGITTILGTTSNSMARVGVQIIVPSLTHYPGRTKIECKISADVECEGAATGAMDLYDYTAAAAIPNTEEAVTGGAWHNHLSANWFNLTSYQGKSISIRMKRVGGTGSNNIKIEGAAIIFKIS